MMSITYCLYDKESRRHINIGKKMNTPFGYEGPLVFANGEFGLLPEQLLHLLKKRFIEAHGEQNVALWDNDDLFDSYLPNGVDVISVGGDEDNSIPLEFYLPELVQTASNKAA